MNNKLPNLRDLLANIRGDDVFSGLIERIDCIQFDELGYLRAHPEVADAVARGEFPSGYAHWKTAGEYENRNGSALSPYRNRRMWTSIRQTDEPIVHFYGPISRQSGLGTAARGYVQALTSAGAKVTAFDTSHIFEGKISDRRPAPTETPDIVVIHHNADTFNLFFRAYSDAILNDVYVIGIWVWELAAFRASWIEHFAAVDEVWSPSHFSADAIRSLAPAHIPVNVVPHVIEHANGQHQFGRLHFGIPEDCFAFLYTFDVSSALARKNPSAAIRAFKNEFGDDPSALLVLKYHSSSADAPRVRELRQLSLGSNVIYLDNLLSSDESSSLKNACDVFLSPHRSEGFGINIAEAMLAGKPIIATGYSGNLEFNDENNSLLIDYRLTEVAEGSPHYPAGCLWAEPDVNHLGSLMRRARVSDSERQLRARRGCETVGSKLSVRAVGETVADLLRHRGAAFNRSSEIREAFAHRALYTWRHPLSLYAGVGAPVESGPIISIIVPVFNIDPEYLRACVNSVLRQTYVNWELILCDDASTRLDTIAFLRSLAGTDQRIKLRWLDQNQGIAVSSNAAVEMAIGEFVAFLDNDDELHAEALSKYVTTIEQHPGVGLLYCDEDKIRPDGERVDHYLKPDWSPEHLESCMYVLHMLVVRKSLFVELGGFRAEFSGAQDYDLALRISLAGAEVRHVSSLLYHWRMIPGSAAEKVDAKPDALLRAKLAVSDYAARKWGADATVEDGLLKGTFRIRRGAVYRPPVTLVITTSDLTKEVEGRGMINLPANLLKSIAEKTLYDNFSVLLATNGSLNGEAARILSELGGREIVFTGRQKPFNFSQKANFAIRSAQSDIVVLMNDDMEVRNPDWLQALLDHVQTGDVGAVGGRLLYASGNIQHVGIAVGVNEGTAHIYHGHPADTVGYNGFPNIVRNYSAVTGACLATKRSVFDQVGGFDTAFATDFNDTDYCLKLVREGYRIVYTPYCELYHFESQTSVRSVQDPAELELFRSRWSAVMERDPYMNPGLSNRSITFEAIEGWDRS